MNSVTNVEVINRYVGPKDECLPPVQVKISTTYQLEQRHIDMLSRMVNNPAPDGNPWVEFRNHDEEEERDIDVCWDLQSMDAIEPDEMAWHTTFHLTDIGRDLVSKLHFSY